MNLCSDSWNNYHFIFHSLLVTTRAEVVRHNFLGNFPIPIMSTYKVEVLPIEKTLLGEGPHWDASTGTLYFVDIMGSSVRSYHPETGKASKIKIGS